MIEWLLILIGLAGFSLAGYYDLKTTEFSEWIPYAMIILAVLTKLGYGIFANDYNFLVNSVGLGALLLVTGLVLHYTGQWGDGDAYLLGAMGFLLPVSPESAFSIGFLSMAALINLFLLGTVYMLIYAIALGLKHPSILNLFVSDLKGNVKMLTLLLCFFALFTFSLPFIIANYLGVVIPLEALYPMAWFLPVFVVVLILWRYAKVVENNLFVKKIPAKELKAGDVLMKSKLWVGITKKELERIKKSKTANVQIKEGVRFSPVFVFAFMITIAYGNLFMIFLGF